MSSAPDGWIPLPVPPRSVYVLTVKGRVRVAHGRGRQAIDMKTADVLDVVGWVEPGQWSAVFVQEWQSSLEDRVRGRMVRHVLCDIARTAAAFALIGGAAFYAGAAWFAGLVASLVTLCAAAEMRKRDGD